MSRGSPIVLHTADPRIRALIGGWLGSSEILVPRPVELTIVIGQVPASSADCSPRLTHGPVSIFAGSADGGVDFVWEPALGRAKIPGHGTSASVVVTPAALERPDEMVRAFVLSIVIVLLRRVGLHHVHAAVIQDREASGWLLIGESRSGKSTTASLLGRQGWAVGTDDLALLWADEPAAAPVEAVAWRERLSVRDDMVAAIGSPGGAPIPARGKHGWGVEELGIEWLPRTIPKRLGFPSVHPSDPTEIVLISARQALMRLMAASPWLALEPQLASEHLQLMSRLVAQAPAYAISLGRDVVDRPARLAALFDHATRVSRR
jgi:hypothetical protein